MLKMTDFINNNSRIALDLMEEQTGAPYALLKQLAHEDYFKILKRRYEGRKDFQSLQAHRKDFQDHVFPKLFTQGGNPLLRTIKRISSQKFRKIVILFLKKQHLTEPGMKKIVKLQANLNLATAA